jgi:hypothetical protein
MSTPIDAVVILMKLKHVKAFLDAVRFKKYFKMLLVLNYVRTDMWRCLISQRKGMTQHLEL